MTMRVGDNVEIEGRCVAQKSDAILVLETLTYWQAYCCIGCTSRSIRRCFNNHTLVGLHAIVIVIAAAIPPLKLRLHMDTNAPIAYVVALGIVSAPTMIASEFGCEARSPGCMSVGFAVIVIEAGYALTTCRTTCPWIDDAQSTIVLCRTLCVACLLYTSPSPRD